MTSRQLTAYHNLATSLCFALTIGMVACGDDDGDSKSADAGSVALDSSIATPDAASTAGDAGGRGQPASDPRASAACLGQVYSELSDGCSACACGVDPQLAPSCGRPCWDFLSCTFAAQAGACATSAAGGAAMRPQFEACIMEQCGAQLAVPGAEVVSSYRSIVGACAVPMGGAKAACGDDIAKFTSELKKP